MKIAITSHGENMDAAIDSRFGRAEYFIIFDQDSNTWECQPNTQSLEATHGAGIQAAQNILKAGASAVITGYAGPKAFKVLAVGHVDIYSVGTMAGTVQEALEAFNAGTLTKVAVPNAMEPKI